MVSLEVWISCLLLGVFYYLRIISPSVSSQISISCSKIFNWKIVSISRPIDVFCSNLTIFRSDNRIALSNLNLNQTFTSLFSWKMKQNKCVWNCPILPPSEGRIIQTDFWLHPHTTIIAWNLLKSTRPYLDKIHILSDSGLLARCRSTLQLMSRTLNCNPYTARQKVFEAPSVRSVYSWQRYVPH